MSHLFHCLEFVIKLMFPWGVGRRRGVGLEMFAKKFEGWWWWWWWWNPSLEIFGFLGPRSCCTAKIKILFYKLGKCFTKRDTKISKVYRPILIAQCKFFYTFSLQLNSYFRLFITYFGNSCILWQNFAHCTLFFPQQQIIKLI